MASVKSRVERLEDQLLPKPEVTGPYTGKEVSEEWVAEVKAMMEEFFQKYPPTSDFELREHGN